MAAKKGQGLVRTALNQGYRTLLVLNVPKRLEFLLVLNFAVVQVHADFVADLELPVWLLWGWHARNVSRVSHFSVALSQTA